MLKNSILFVYISDKKPYDAQDLLGLLVICFSKELKSRSKVCF